MSWTSFTVGATASAARIRGIWFRTPQNGVLVKENGEIFYTLTGGGSSADWLPATETAVSQVGGVTCDHNGVFWSAGYSSESGQNGVSNMILKSLDNGATWTAETVPPLTFNTGRLMRIDTFQGTTVAVGRNNVIYAHHTSLQAPGYATLELPANNSVGINPAEITLSWNPPSSGPQVAHYQIFVSDDEDFLFSQYFFEAAGSSFNLSAALADEGITLAHGTRWFWGVLPVGENLNSPCPFVDEFQIWNFTIMADPSLPQTPHLQIEVVANQVRLSWDSDPNAVSYRIMGCATPYGEYIQIGQTSLTQYLFTEPLDLYFFKVIASSE